jgi:pyruvate ferredoxin oxidoreductase delta subunit
MSYSIGAVIEQPGSTTKTKTGGWRTLKPVWHQEKCIQCMLCWLYCPDMSIPEKDKKRIETDLEYCKGCGICAQVCPVKCIEIIQEQK